MEISPVGQQQRPDEFYEIRLEHPDWDDWHPGQFVMVRPVSWPLDLVLARPFSIYTADATSVTIFIQKTGRGTSRLAGLRPGDAVTIWGPLGNSFAMEPDTPTLLLAGGIGIAPFRAYVERHPHPDNLRLFLAHRVPLECYPYALLAEDVCADCVLEKTSSDVQVIIDAMGKLIREYADKGGLVLACGPTPFMRTAQRFAAEYGVRTQVSLENRMGCGVGACLGCVAKDAAGHHVQVCTRGPVFWADKVEL